MEKLVLNHRMTADEKRAALAEWLLNNKAEWPAMERQNWATANGYPSESIRRQYFCGFVHSIPVAEALVRAVEQYIENKACVPA